MMLAQGVITTKPKIDDLLLLDYQPEELMALREVEGEAGLDLGDVLGPEQRRSPPAAGCRGWRRVAVGLALPGAADHALVGPERHRGALRPAPAGADGAGPDRARLRRRAPSGRPSPASCRSGGRRSSTSGPASAAGPWPTPSPSASASRSASASGCPDGWRPPSTRCSRPCGRCRSPPGCRSPWCGSAWVRARPGSWCSSARCRPSWWPRPTARPGSPASWSTRRGCSAPARGTWPGASTCRRRCPAS